MQPNCCPIVFEPLEQRLLLSANCPVINQAVADNRGQIVLEVNRDLNAATVNQSSVQVFTAGADLLMGTADDVLVARTITYDATNRTITINADTATDQRYRLRLDSSVITALNGRHLDGEFNGATIASGDGVEGGDYELFTRRSLSTIARMTTVSGIIDVRLFTDRTPLSVINFLNYANRGDWDGTFFHRSVANFVIQSGGFRAAPGFANIPEDPPVLNEPGISNIRGTIAMAKRAGDPNSATSEWFFNLGDNSANLDNQNGGFTAFGEIINTSGLSVMDAIAAFQNVNASAANPAFSNVPVVDPTAFAARGNVLAPSDVISISRISVLMDISSQPAQQLSTSGAVVINNPNGGSALVRVFDLDGTGLPAASQFIDVRFGARNVIQSISLIGPFTGARIGIQISGADRVGSFTDSRDTNAGNLAFLLSDAKVGTIRAHHGLSGFNLNGFVLPGFVLDQDIDGDGDIADSLAVFVPGGQLSSLSVQSGLSGDVVTGSIANVTVRGTARDADFDFSAGRNSRFRFETVLDSNIRTTGQISSIQTREWLDTRGGPEIISAQSIRTIVATGGSTARSAGDFDAGLRLTGDPLGAPALVSFRIAGGIFAGNWDIQGDVRLIRIRGDASFWSATISGNIGSVMTGSLRGVDITAGGLVTSLRARDWLGGSLSAQAARSIRIMGPAGTGNFEADLSLSGSTDPRPTLTSMVVQGDITGGSASITGDIRLLNVRGSVRNFTADIMGSGEVRNIRLQEVVDSDLTVNGTVRNLIATHWRGGTISGVEFRRASFRNDVRADMNINTLGSLRVGSSLESNLNTLTAELIDVRGDILNSVIRINLRNAGTDPALGRLLVQGELRSSSVHANQDIGFVSLTSMRNSRIIVGFQEDVQTLPDDASQQITTASLDRFIILGMPNLAPSMINSIIVTPHLGSASIHQPMTDNGSHAFGIAAGTIDRATVRIGTTTLLTGTPIGSVASGDFQIRINFVLPA